MNQKPVYGPSSESDEHRGEMASHFSMEEGDIAVLSDVKIEIDVAEETPQDWHMTEPFTDVPARKSEATVNTASMSAMQRVGRQDGTNTYSWLQHEQQTPEQQTAVNTLSVGLLTQGIQTQETKTVANTCTFSDTWLKEEPKTPESQTADNTDHVSWLKQEQQTPATETAVNIHSGSCVKQETQESETLPMPNVTITVYRLRTKSNQKDHACTVCKARFTQACDLKRHMLRHYEEKKHECKECGAWFTWPCLMKHVMKHRRKKKYVCTLCGARLKESRNLNQHMKTHTRKHECSECGARFSRPTCLKRHMKRHKGEKKHACTECGARFIESYNLEQHMLTHAKYTQSEDMNNMNLLTHSEKMEQAFVNTVHSCDAGFTRFGHLKQNLERMPASTEGMARPQQTVKQHSVGILRKVLTRHT